MTSTRPSIPAAVKQLRAAHTARFERDARAIASLTHPHICTLFDIGPDYLVMEFVDGGPCAVRPIDARSDVFAIGALLYERLSGERAFPGTSSAALLTAVLRDEPPPLLVSGAIAGIVTRCLRKDPRERFADMADVKAALECAAVERLEDRSSVAVLPFADLSPERDNEWFSDGLADEIVTALARLPGMKVIARTSAFAFKGQQANIRQVAARLGVAHVLEGSVRKAGTRIRVAVQQIAASDGSHVWSGRYDRDLADVFAVQDEIADSIATALNATLSASPSASRVYTPTLPAYEAFLNGRHHQWRFTPESIGRSREYFERACALDPGFALAHSELAWHHFTLAMVGLVAAHEAMPIARTEALPALTLDPSLPAAHAMLALAAALYDYDWPEAERRFMVAASGQPLAGKTRLRFALFYLLYLGRVDDAIAALAPLVRDDPLWLLVHDGAGMCQLVADRVPEAIGEFEHALELDETFMMSHGGLAIAHWTAGRLDAALACAERTYALAPWDPIAIGLCAGMRRLANQNEEAVAASFGDGAGYGAPIGRAVMHLICGEVGPAADWVVKAIDQRYPGILAFVNRPIGRALRTSDRWPAIAAAMRLPGRTASDEPRREATTRLR